MEGTADGSLDGEALRCRARGCMLGVFIGDALGAGVEGWPADEIEQFATERWQSPLVEDFFPAVHLATHVPAGEPGQYREARWMEEIGFRAVPVGPPRNDAIAKQCAREGCYTDDTLASLALAASLVQHGRVDANAAALAAIADRATWEQALWEGLFTALGYKQNSWPMRRLAE